MRNKQQLDKCRQHSGRSKGSHSLAGLIFGIVSFSISLAFKAVGLVFSILFGLLSGISTGSRNSFRPGNNHGTPIAAKTENAEGDNAADSIAEIKRDNIREFKGHPAVKTKNTAEAVAAVGDKQPGKGGIKELYIVLFIFTIIPVIITLAMGELLYAGAIGATGLGLMLLAGAVSGIAGSLRKRAEEKEKEEDKEEQKGDSPVESLIKDAFEKLYAIRKDTGSIKDAGVKAKIEAICCTGEKIIGEVRSNPEGLTHVRKFFYYYLDAFSEIVKKYLRLSNFGESSEEIGNLIAETERSFEDISEIFKDLCEKLLEKDMMHLKAEINVIRSGN